MFETPLLGEPRKHFRFEKVTYPERKYESPVSKDISPKNDTYRRFAKPQSRNRPIREVPSRPREAQICQKVAEMRSQIDRDQGLANSIWSVVLRATGRPLIVAH